ncbi:MAG: helix-turn-helix transcriptional regulator [Clostridia bacterium]|nr:helix-turn-helix transcriptional regulator [Clostridia bacterium]
MIIDEKIMRLRRMRGWTQEELADKVGVSRQAVSRWESGGALPDVDKILLLAELFEVSTDYLLKDSETLPEAPDPDHFDKLTNDQNRENEITLTDLERYLSSMHSAASNLGVGCLLFLLSPVLLLIFSIIDTDLAMYGGMPILIFLLILGSTLIILGSTRVGKWRYIFLSDYHLTPSAKQLLLKYQEKNRAKRNTLYVISIISLILSIIPLIPMSIIGGELANAICLSIFLLFLSISASTFSFAKTAFGRSFKLN